MGCPAGMPCWACPRSFSVWAPSSARGPRRAQSTAEEYTGKAGITGAEAETGAGTSRTHHPQTRMTMISRRSAQQGKSRVAAGAWPPVLLGNNSTLCASAPVRGAGSSATAGVSLRSAREIRRSTPASANASVPTDGPAAWVACVVRPRSSAVRSSRARAGRRTPVSSVLRAISVARSSSAAAPRPIHKTRATSASWSMKSVAIWKGGCARWLMERPAGAVHRDRAARTLRFPTRRSTHPSAAAMRRMSFAVRRAAQLRPTTVVAAACAS